MMGAAAMVMGVSFVACSNHENLYDAKADAQTLVDKYETAFKNAFGQPAANQTWGFSDEAAGARMTRAITPDYDFTGSIPTKPTTDKMAASNFKENVDGIDAYTNGGYAIGVSYISGSTDVNIWGGGGTEENGWKSSGGELYFTGTCDLSNNNFYLAGNSTIYLVKGAQVTLNNGFQGDCKVYIAEGAKLTINNDIGTGNVSYYIKGGSFEAKKLLVVNGGNEFFVENGSVKVGGEFQMDDATYYAKNTPLEIGGKLNLIIRTNPSLFYNEGGTITCAGELLNNSCKFYTDANSTFSNLSANGLCVNYNGPAATMTFNGEIKVYNSNAKATDGSVLINDGTLNGTYLGTEGGALFENNGLTNISGETVVNSNFNTWVNNGTYNTNTFSYTAGSTQVINNCRLNAADDFYMNLGDTDRNAFRMDANCGVVTKTLHAVGPFYITMGSGSVFEVTETATITATKAEYGFYGPSSGEYAVLHANKIDYAPNYEYQGYKVTYAGSKMAVVSETTHFPQGLSGNYPYIDFAEGCSIENIYAEGFNTNAPAIYIPSSTCNPGFQREGTVDPIDPVITTTKSIRIIAEDLSATEASDFDFNDVVFDVEADFAVSETVNKVKITLWAAGGTLPLRINSKNGVGGFEVHQALGIQDMKTMINTHAKTIARDPYKWADNISKYTETITLVEGSIRKEHFNEDVNEFVRVEVQKVSDSGNEVWCLLTAQRGKPACKIGVPVGTPWLLERNKITDAFTRFQDWVNTAEPQNWYSSRVASHFYNGGMSTTCEHGCPAE